MVATSVNGRVYSLFAMGIMACLFVLITNILPQHSDPKHKPASEESTEHISTQTGSFPDTLLAATYFQKASEFRKQARYDSAAALYQNALDIYRQAAAWEKAVNCQAVLGRTFEQLGDYDRSLQILNRALATGLERLGKDHLVVANVYNNLGILYEMKAHYDRSLTYYRQSLAIRQRLLDENDRIIAINYANMGVLSRKMGDYDQSLAYYNRALNVLREVLGEDHPRIGMIYGNIGVVHKHQADYENQLQYTQKALTIFKNALGENHPAVATCYNNIGNAYFEQNMFREAQLHYQKALPIWQERYGETHPDVAMSYINLGNVYAKLGDYPRAEEYYRKELAISRQLLGEHHPYLSETYLSLGNVFRKQGHISQSLSYFQQALGVLSPGFDNTQLSANPTPDQVLSETHLLQILQAKGEALTALYATEDHPENDITPLKDAMNVYQSGADLVDQMRQGYKAEGSKLLLGRQAVTFYGSAIATALQLSKMTGDTQYQEMAFRFCEKGKSSVLLEALSDAQARQFAGIPDDLLEADRQLRIDLAFYDKQLSEQLQRGAEADSAKVRDLRDIIFKLNSRYQSHVTRLESDFPEYFRLKYQVSSVSPGALQKFLPDDRTAIVEYFTGDSAVHIFVITRKHFKVYTGVLPANFTQQVHLLRTGLINNDFLSYSKYAFQLYRILVEPVADQLPERLVIIPDGATGYIPFEALLTTAANREDRDFRKLAYLLKDYQVSYAYSATQLYDTALPKKDPAPYDFLAFAPVFPESARTGYVSQTREIFKDTNDKYTSRVWDGNRRSLKPLPATEKEVSSIWNMFQRKGRSGQLFTYQKAVEARVKSPVLQNYRYLHFATHGIVNEENPALSGIILAQEEMGAASPAPTPMDAGEAASQNAADTNEDNVLYAGEIYNLNLNADLVVLSACETGLGKQVKGEGIIGLTRGFLYAGAANLLVSLWQVADQSTATLMIDFYKNMLNNKPKPEALQKAKRQLIRNERYASPYFWSAFVLIGR